MNFDEADKGRKRLPCSWMQEKSPHSGEFPGIKNRGIKKCKAKDNQIIIHFSSVPLF